MHFLRVRSGCTIFSRLRRRVPYKTSKSSLFVRCPVGLAALAYASSRFYRSDPNKSFPRRTKRDIDTSVCHRGKRHSKASSITAPRPPRPSKSFVLGLATCKSDQQRLCNLANQKKCESCTSKKKWLLNQSSLRYAVHQRKSCTIKNAPVTTQSRNGADRQHVSNVCTIARIAKRNSF